MRTKHRLARPTAFAVLFAVVLGANAVRADEVDDIAKAGVLKVGVFSDFPPFPPSVPT